MAQTRGPRRSLLPALLLLGGALACAGTQPSDGSSSSGGAPSASGGSTAGRLGTAGSTTAGIGGGPGTGGGDASAGQLSGGGASAAAAGSAGRSSAGSTAAGGRSSAGSAGRESAGGTGTSGQGGALDTAGHSGVGAGGGGQAGFASAGMSGHGGVGTGSAGSGAAGSGGANAYHPCPTDGSTCKIMPFGDSITFGVGDEGNGGYRGPLFAAAVAAGQTITFTGSLSNGPTTVSGETFPKKNEGHSGWGISQVTPYSGNNAGIATVIPSPGFTSGSGGVPHIILLHIGTNDQGTLSASQMTSDLSGLLDKIIANAPDAYLVVAQIIPLGYGNNDVIKTYNQSIPGLVKQRADAGKHITSVDMFTGFTAGSMLDSDSIHPNAAGYEFMADHWYTVIGPLLPP